MSFVGTRVEDCELPKTWRSGRLDDVCHQMKQGKVLPQKEIRETGSYPVFGANGCIGYCEEYFLEEPRVLITCRGSTCGVINRSPARSFVTNNAMILFEKECLDNDFLSFVLQEFSTKGLRNGSGQPQLTQGILNSHAIPLPPLPEQKKIAHILSTVQWAIEAQERIIQTTTELKKALRHKFFTKGIRNEPQKQTEIGPVPESWDLVRCEEACETISVGIVVKPTQYYVPTGVPALRSQNVRVDRIQMQPMVYISEEANAGPVAKSKLRTGDVLIVRTGANLGMSCVLPAELDGCNCIDLLFIRTKPERLNDSFLSRFINSVEAKKQIGAGKTGMAQPHFNVGTVRRIFVPLPSLEEQEAIVFCLEKIDQKHDVAEAKQKALQDLFRTLLHELMTAKTRVHELEIST